MSNIRKALENENVSEDKIKKVLKELGIKESKRWVSEIGEEYWVTHLNRVTSYKRTGDEVDLYFELTGNMFKAKEEAEHHRDKLKFLAQMKIDFEDNSDDIDWSNKYQTKYHVRLHHRGHIIEVDCWSTIQQQGAMLTTNKKWLEKYIIDNERQNKKYCFGIE